MSAEFEAIAPTIAIEDVAGTRRFFRALLDAGINFHPDTPARDIGHSPDGGYSRDSWVRTFTDVEAWLLDRAMEFAMDAAEAVGADGYGIACDVFEEWERAS